MDTKEKGAAFVTKAAPRSLFLCTGPAPAGAFRSATERNEALGAEIGTFLFLFQEKKKCGAQPFPALRSGVNDGLSCGGNNTDFSFIQTVEQRIKLSACGAFSLHRILIEKLIHGDTIACNQLKEYLEAWMLSFVFNISKITGRKYISSPT